MQAAAPTHLAKAPPAGWHALGSAEVASRLRTDLERGVSESEAAARLATAGPNVLTMRHEEPWWEALVEPLTEPLVLLLVAVGVLYAIFGELRDALTILVVILAVAGVEAFTERRAKHAITALRGLSAPTATVVRAGQPSTIPATGLVQGDSVLLQPGDRVPADVRLVDASALRVDESSLTGESVPVAKRADLLLPLATELGDRRNLAFAGTLVVAGNARGVVVATGRATELGRIARLAEEVREPRTPLQQQMRQLAGWLLWLALGFSILVPILGVLIAHRPLQEMVLTGLTLAFATIPEELPILITIVLGIGAYQLARRHAIVKRLSAAETLGSVSVVGTDKTGTLTENRMRVAQVYADGVLQLVAARLGGTAARLLEIGVLANDAQLARSSGHLELVGDPTETALLAAAQANGVDLGALRAGAEVVEELPFDDDRKRMSVVVTRDGVRWLATKGAPEALLGICTTLRAEVATVPLDADRRAELQAAADAMTARGLRVLAFAERQLPASEPSDGQGPTIIEREQTFLGLAGLEDPPRPEAADAVATLRQAGVRVLMLTGDHPGTAHAVAERVGIPADRLLRGRDLDGLDDAGLATAAREVSVFARITAAHKLRVVRALQAQGEVMAVTGDGVNDGPALREAAVGVAMGRSGTEVAREAADLVLADDNFATVTVAVRGGRVLFANLRKAVRYYLAAKVALITASLVAVLAQLPVPFTPVQIIVLELFMDLGASTAFVAEPPEEDVMARPPRDPRRPFMDTGMQLGILAGGLSLATAVLVGYLWSWSQDAGADAAHTTAFATWIVGHLALAAHMRSERQPLLRTNPLANRPYMVWVVAALGVLALGANVPLLQERLHLVPLPASAWLVAGAAGLLLPAWWEVWKWFDRRVAERRALPGAA